MRANLANERFYLRLIRKGLLRVTKSGRCFNLRTGRELGRAKGTGYRKISWMHPKTKRIHQIQLHRLIWCYFKGVPDDPELEINHCDGNKQNCALLNLELITGQANSIHASIILGRRTPLGEERLNAKFKDSEVRRCRRLFAQGKVTCKQIKHRFDCSYSVVSTMLSGRRYSHITTRWDAKCKVLIGQ